MIINDYFQKSSDGTNLYFKEWIPEGEKKAIICLVHGLGDHSGWYNSLVNYLTNNGFIVTSFDQRGHGKSQGKRGHTSSYEILLKDINLLIDSSEKHFENLPVFLYGHSFGGNLVLNYAIRYHPKISGVVSTSPWLRLYKQPNVFTYSFATLLDKIWPSFTFSNAIIPDNLSHDELIKATYIKDPLVHGFITARLLKNAHKRGLWAIDHANEINIPILLFHGDSDKITSSKSSEEFYTNAKEGLCTFKLWPGLFHSLHNESSNQELFVHLKKWLDSILSKK